MGRRGQTNIGRGLSKQRQTAPRQAVRQAAGDDAAALAAVLSDSSLDDDLLDYLENIHKQQQDSSGDEAAAQQPQQGMHTPVAATEQTPESPAQQQQPPADDLEDPDDWRPSGLGYRPQHGFDSATAAAQFADTSLDHMLEGNLAQDMHQGDSDDSSSSSSSSSSDGSDSDSDTGSSSGSESDSDEQAEGGRAGSSFAASGPVVVDASGRQQCWLDLSLVQRFPVQARQPQASPSAAAGSSGSARGGKHKQRPPGGSMRDTLAQNISTSMLLSNRQGSVPEFQSEGVSAAVAAATAAATEAAKQQVAQYAELAQQLQQGKQNQSKRPGRQGKGAKKQLKKAKVSAKRTAREARSESGCLQLLAAVEVFAGSGQDMQVLPPCGSRQREGFAKQLARLFGVSASSQGGGSSGRTCLVLQATPELQQQPDVAGLSQLQVLLRGELAKELAAATIAKDDTVHTLKKQEKQRRRSAQQQAGMQRQGSRGAAARGPTPDYQQPVQFVAAGLLDPNSSILKHDEYVAADAAGSSTDGTESDSSSSSNSSSSDSGSGSESDTGAAEPTAAGVAGGAVGPSHAEVGAFLESLLLQEEGQQLPAAAPAAAAAAAAAASVGSTSQEQEHHKAQPAWYIDRDGSPEGGVSGRLGLGFAAAPAADGDLAAPSDPNAQQQQQQQPLPPGESAAGVAGISKASFVPTWFEDKQPQQQQQQQQGPAAQAAGGSSTAAFVPTWFEDKAPERTVYSQGGRGLGFVAAGTSDDDFASRKPHQPPAAAAAAAAAGMSGGGDGADAPLYTRAGLGLGLGLRAATAAAAEPDIDTLLGLPKSDDGGSDADGWQQAGLGRRQGRRKGGSGRGRDRVAELEAEFKSLQTPGGRAAAAVPGGSKQERKQRRKQQKQQQRQASRGGNSNLEAWMLAAGATAAAVDAQPSFNVTAQQSKKSKKQQQRNQRREANKAAGETGGAAAAGGGGMQQQQQQQAVGFATFEVHTTGIGSRLLAQWGWSEGEGLGRARQGRAEPLRAERRPKQLGLGFE